MWVGMQLEEVSDGAAYDDEDAEESADEEESDEVGTILFDNAKVICMFCI